MHSDPHSTIKTLSLPDPYNNYGPLETTLWVLLAHKKMFSTPWMTLSDIHAVANEWLKISIDKKSVENAITRAKKKVVKKTTRPALYSIAHHGETYLKELVENTVVKKGPTKQTLAKYVWHKRVNEVSLKQFQEGHYKEAIQNALVEVIDQVKKRSGNPKKDVGNNRTIDLDGDDLMNRVFSCDTQTPKIRFNELQTGLDKAEQRGIMNMFKGIVGIRDKKAHLNYLQNDINKAIEYLCLASLLMRLLEEGIVDNQSTTSLTGTR
jgi:uncharacterized protein (TIGR02391 family)